MSRTGQSGILKAWPYAVFLALAGVYSWFTLGEGFNATDEGYLLSLGQRILDGEAPYRDFYFLRTPGSIYIQAGLLAALGDSYTVLASRVFWLLQMLGATMLLSVFYRRFADATELLLLLLATFAASTLLMIFPWYNYDAAFFGIVAAVCLYRRRFLLVGVAAFLAAFCKQSYLGLLPAFMLLALLVRWRRGVPRLLGRREIERMVIGFAIPAILYAAFLAITDSLGAFYRNVFVYPSKASQTELAFALFQDHPTGFLQALPLTAAVAAWYFLRRRDTLSWSVRILTAAGAGVALFWSHHVFIYSLVYFGLFTGAIGVLRIVFDRTARKNRTLVALLPILLIGVVLQYLAGLNYAGLVLAYTGAGLLLAAGYLVIRDSGFFVRRRFAALVFLALLLAAGGYWKYTYVYRDVPRANLQSEFRIDKLAGITSHRRNTWQLEQMVRAVRERTEPGDYIFVFPDFPILYYLTDRRNPTPIPWYVQMEFGGPMITRALESLRRHPPVLIFLQTYFEIDYGRGGATIEYEMIPRYQFIHELITTEYEREATIGDIDLYVPKGDGAAGG